MTCGLWWSYFVKAKPILDQIMEEATVINRIALGRDAFSFFHFAMLAGIISYTLAVEEALAHPSDPLSTEGRMALGIGLLLFIGGTALSVWRASNYIMLSRIVLILILSIIISLGIIPIHQLIVGLTGVIMIVYIEQVNPPKMNVES